MKSIPIIIVLLFCHSVNAQIKGRLEFGFNMGNFNHRIKHQLEENQSSNIDDFLAIPLELFANYYLNDKKTYLSLRYLIHHSSLDERDQNHLNNTNLNRYSENFSIDGFYIGAGRDLFNRQNHVFQAQVNLGYTINENRYVYHEIFMENKLTSTYELFSPRQSEISVQLQLKYKYSFFKRIYIAVGVNNTLSYHFEEGHYENINKTYDNGTLINVNEINQYRKITSFKFHTWEGFIGLGFKF